MTKFVDCHYTKKIGLFLIHGIGAAKIVLSKHFTVITYDLRGHISVTNLDFLNDLIADLERLREKNKNRKSSLYWTFFRWNDCTSICKKISR